MFPHDRAGFFLKVTGAPSDWLNGRRAPGYVAMDSAAIHRHALTTAAYGLPQAAQGAQGTDPATDEPTAIREGARSGSSGAGPAVVNHVQPAAALPEEPGSERQGDAGDSDGGQEQPGAGNGSRDPSDVSGRDRGQEHDAEEDPSQAAELRKLQARDAEVRAHEQAHAAAGGAHAGSPRYEYERGPDGRNYAVSGEVPIDVSSVSGDPQATIQKMQQVKRAALAPASPSGTDRNVASRADAKAAAARRELAEERSEGPEGQDEAEGTTAARDGRSMANKAGAPAPPSFEALSRRAGGRSAYAVPAADVGGTVSVLSCSNCGGSHAA